MDELRLHIRKRITFLTVSVFCILALLMLRFAWIQVISNSEYQSKALSQRLRELKVEPKRGIIYDRNGVALALSASADTVVAIPKEIQNPEKTASKLADILGMSEEEVYKRITRRAAASYVARKVDEDKAEKIRELDLKGITFTEESRRFYPRGELASHILGFSGVDSQGLQGIELSYDRYLRGNPGRISIESDAIGRQIPQGISDYSAPDDGNDIYLTIDNVLQYIVERELDKALVEHQAQGATIVMMDPKTGDILAMGNRPTYDPNNFAKFAPRLWRDRAVSDTYEPGSTFKIITTATALEEGVVNVNDKFFDPGYIEVSGQRINCWKAGGHGMQTFAEVVQNSCNPGFVQVGQRIGRDDFYKYIKAFGFGERTNVNLPGEGRGLMYSLPQIGPVELATISFGHGITATPIQLTSAVSAIANDGQLLKPNLVKEVRDKEGELVEEIQSEEIRRVVSKDTSKLVRELLEGVVEEGSGMHAAIDGYRIGGKTGTAKHYGRSLYDASFIGMVPADDPQLVTLVVLYGVSSYPYYGSQVAAPIFHNVVKDALRYLEIPPNKADTDNEEDRPTRVEVPNLTNLDFEEAEKVLIRNGFRIRLEGEGAVISDQIPYPGAIVDEGSTVILFFEGAEDKKARYRVTVPDLSGMEIEDAAQLLGQLGLRLRWEGSGTIRSQSPVAGRTVDSGDYIRVNLK
ncbi:stage V sporulation protein D [Halonatronum saccharophilum]|uniref:stage V sporulation protein D n=1 Tax=Halonatronum saccharophilum TaxID=150060 RepID=UPI000489AECD|nr:stage V sporulation protein D [Halonatronum saccharophilum]